MIHGIDVKMYAYYVALAGSSPCSVSIWMSRAVRLALKAIRNDEQAAEVVGIRIFPAKLQAMAYGAMAAAVAGGAYIWSFRYIDPRACSGSTSRSFRWRWRCLAAPACCGARWSAPFCSPSESSSSSSN
jgi:ABC-type branched-subunit amino acid transport system permease subunit